MSVDQNTPVSPRWLHALAVLTVILALPLLFLGAGVTSHDVGMVDPRGFRPPWEIINGLFENNGLGWRLEYGHRTFGFLVGLCGIALAVGCWFFDRRTGMGWLGFFALAMIGTQGVLGILRVNYDALNGRTFALIHGVFAQLVFATLVAVALLTSRGWQQTKEAASPALQRWSIVTELLVLVQLLLGGLIRHYQDSMIGPRGHLLGAFVVVAAVVWLIKLNGWRMSSYLLIALLVFQLGLGLESWLAKFHVASAANQQQLAPIPAHGEWIRTVHYLVGSLIFATTASIALSAHRIFALKPQDVRSDSWGLHSGKLEGAL